jgi:hypothetical protein
VLFRLTNEVRGYLLQYRDSIRIDAGGVHRLVVVLRQEPGEGSAAGNVFLDVTAEFEPPRRAATALRDLAQHLVPVDSNPAADLASEIQGRQLPESGRGLRFDELPGSLREFSRKISLELVETAVDVLGLIRWRRAMMGPIQALWHRGMEWSDDSEHWHRFPVDVKWEASALSLPRSTSQEAEELETMMASGIREPLAQAVFREAQRAAAQREYPSALVMGIAALEIGVKQLIGSLIPAAAWLAENAPSPPIVAILRDYLPTLPAHGSIGGQVIPPPEAVLEVLKKAVTARNATVHAGQGKLHPDFIALVQEAIADVLWMCDYFSGNKWAFQHLSERTQASLLAAGAPGT